MKKITVVLLLCLIPGVMFSVGKKSVSQSDVEYVQNMSEEEIVTKNSYSKSSSITKTSNGKTTIKVKRFSGVEEIMVISPKNQNIEISVSSEVDSGALRIVVCDKENIVYEFETGEKDQTFRLPSTKGRYVLKTVGKNARYTLEIGVQTTKTELPSFESMVL